MSWPKGTHPGALWRRIDIQIHTPRDPDWQDGESLPGSSEKQETARKTWADKFVRYCVENDIDVVALTDHHDFCLHEYVRQAIDDAALTETLWLFPGIEITCDDNVQCIVLLDRDASRSQCARVLNILPNVSEIPKESAKLPNPEPCGKTITQLSDELDKISQLTGRYILLPNGSKSGGHKTILKSGQHVTFRQLNFDGVYIDGSFSGLKKADRDKLYGNTEKWGDRRRGALPTSDARSLNDIGRAPCWVRLGEPNTEALRQALLVDEARIAYSRPQQPSTLVDKLVVKSSLTRRRLTLQFNDGLNTIIGGRGSGKSAILEYLRFALGRAESDIRPDWEQLDRAQDLVQNTLGDGFVEATVLRDGVRETWHRTTTELDTIKVTVNDETFTITSQEAQERFHARGYSQKQLSSLTHDTTTARQQVTGLAAAEDLSRESDLKQQVRKIQASISSRVADYERAVRDEYEIEDLNIKIADLQRRIDATSKSLEERGLSQSEQSTLDRAPKFDEFSSQISHGQSEINAIREVLGGISHRLQNLDISPADMNLQNESLTKSLNEFHEEKANSIKTLQTAEVSLKSLHERATSVGKTFRPIHDQMQMDVRKVREKQTELKKTVEQKTKLQNELVELRQQLRTLQRDLVPSADARQSLYNDQKSLRTHAKALSELLSTAATKSERLGAGLISAEVAEPESPINLKQALKSIGDRCNIVDLEGKCEVLASQIVSGGSDQAIDQLTDSLLNLLAYRVRNEQNPSNIIPEQCQSRLGDNYLTDLTGHQSIKICQNLTVEKVAAIAGLHVEQYIEFRYRDEDGTYIAFEKASPGQQASALLEVLLNQQAGPLIIDQPEDDLDNQRIMTIVRTLQRTKQNRQIVFSTHNPNFVVNGDADKVFALGRVEGEATSDTSPRVRIRVDGALETKKVREQITDTMEGGRRAFELRRRKYRFAR